MGGNAKATIVTGGGRGIGRAIALRMAREGPVVLVGRTPSDLESARREVAGRGGEAEVCAGDVADPDTAARSVRMAADRGWDVANLVCNAGIGKGGPTHEFDPDLWRAIFEVNVHGSFHFIRACLPPMLELGRGAICLMSSVGGVRGLSHDAAYSASKHALVGLARSLALEYGKKGIVVVPICPGFVAGEMTERTIRGIMARGGVSEEEARRKVEATNPQRRIIPPEEVAEAVALVCSGSIASIAGEPLLLTGGG